MVNRAVRSPVKKPLLRPIHVALILLRPPHHRRLSSPPLDPGAVRLERGEHQEHG
jgi:hypothetical protein